MDNPASLPDHRASLPRFAEPMVSMFPHGSKRQHRRHDATVLDTRGNSEHIENLLDARRVMITASSP